MPRRVYEKIRSDLTGASHFFHQNPDVTGRLGGTTDLKLNTTLQMTADDGTVFSMVKEVCQSEAQNLAYMARF